ncbi:MAG TPA: hypothetical protein VMX17_14035 [Candidatus Glassbacteria bacterium]|nr:hypothetical protein [Candidatus Glassbacteria bacterium]
MGKESKAEEDLNYLDFEYNWGLQKEPKVSLPYSGDNYYVLMNGEVHLKLDITWTKILKSNKITIFGLSWSGMRTAMESGYAFSVRGKYGRKDGSWSVIKPRLIFLSPSHVTYICHSEITLPSWCPYPNVEGNLVNNPTPEKILRVMMEIDREYGRFLYRKFKNEEIQ